MSSLALIVDSIDAATAERHRCGLLKEVAEFHAARATLLQRTSELKRLFAAREAAVQVPRGTPGRKKALRAVKSRFRARIRHASRSEKRAQAPLAKIRAKLPKRAMRWVPDWKHAVAMACLEGATGTKGTRIPECSFHPAAFNLVVKPLGLTQGAGKTLEIGGWNRLMAVMDKQSGLVLAKSAGQQSHFHGRVLVEVGKTARRFHGLVEAIQYAGGLDKVVDLESVGAQVADAFALLTSAATDGIEENQRREEALQVLAQVFSSEGVRGTRAAATRDNCTSRDSDLCDCRACKDMAVYTRPVGAMVWPFKHYTHVENFLNHIC
mmetsp:Transcript_30180/g.76472  ORF Transcript_30180/g.76472 Transcript_30180/m.76472 type:complete len:323 (-) Transcript_30180:74-1042(-)